MKPIINWIVSIASVLALLVFALYLYLNPCPVPLSPEGYWVTIHGRVLPPSDGTLDDTLNKPDYLYVYYPYYNPRYVCRSNVIQLANITWFNETEGTYSVTFRLPVDMDVILTTDCTACNPKNVSITKENNNLGVDVLWGTEKCYETEGISTDPNFLISQNRERANNIEKELTNKKFNDSEKESIRSDIEEARDQIGESEPKIKTDINGSIMHALYSEFFIWKALYKKELFDLKYCIYEVHSLLEQNAEEAYYLDYFSILDYNDSKRIYFSSSNSNVLRRDSRESEEIEEIKLDILWVKSNQNWLIDVNRKCKESSYKLKKTLEYQKPYIEYRKNMCNLVNWVIIIFILFLGILIGNWSSKKYR